MAEQTSYPVRTSFWGTAAPDLATRLETDEIADVVVVGGGISGMSTAYHLKRAEPGLDVVLVEAQYLGYGASGRNFGNVPNMARQAMNLLLERFGTTHTNFLVQHQIRMLEDYERLLKREQIECGFQRSNLLLVATNESEEQGLVELALLHELHGHPSKLLTHDEMRDEFSGPSFGGLSCGSNGYQNAWQFCRGFKQAVIRSGVRIHEGTRAGAVRHVAGGVRLDCGGPAVSARWAVFCTNAYSTLLGFPFDIVQSTYDWVIATKSLDESQVARLGLGTRHRIYTEAGEHGRSYYFQLLPDRRLLFGGGPLPPWLGGRLYDHDNQAQFSQLHHALVERFPFLAQVEIEVGWGGPIGMTETRLPVVDEVSDSVYLNAGYNYRGALMGAMSGVVLAGRILGGAHVDPEYQRYGDLVGAYRPSER